MGSIGGMDLGTFGIWTFDFEDQPAAQMRDSVREVEEQGWRTFWIPELLGREAFSHAGFLLSCTERIHIINGVAKVTTREPQWMVGGSRLLADAYPNRYVLGLGLGAYNRPGTTPLAAMTTYLDDMDGLETPNPAPAAPLLGHPALLLFEVRLRDRVQELLRLVAGHVRLPLELLVLLLLLLLVLGVLRALVGRRRRLRPDRHRPTSSRCRPKRSSRDTRSMFGP